MVAQAEVKPLMSMKRTVTSGSTWVVSLNEVERESGRGVGMQDCRMLLSSSLIMKEGESIECCQSSEWLLVKG